MITTSLIWEETLKREERLLRTCYIKYCGPFVLVHVAQKHEPYRTCETDFIHSASQKKLLWKYNALSIYLSTSSIERHRGWCIIGTTWQSGFAILELFRGWYQPVSIPLLRRCFRCLSSFPPAISSRMRVAVVSSTEGDEKGSFRPQTVRPPRVLKQEYQVIELV